MVAVSCEAVAAGAIWLGRYFFFSKGRQEFCRIFIRRRKTTLQYKDTQLKTTPYHTPLENRLHAKQTHHTPLGEKQQKLKKKEKPLGGLDESVDYSYRLLKLLDVFLD